MRLAKALDTPPNFYHWRSAGGAEVDLILERDGVFYPIEIKSSSKLSKHDTRGIISFRETYPKINIGLGLIIYTGSETYALNENVLAMPWNVCV